MAKTLVEKEICDKLRNGEFPIAYMKKVGYSMEQWGDLRRKLLEAERKNLCIKLTTEEMET